MQINGLAMRMRGMGDYTPDPADLIPDGTGLFYDVFGGGTWFYNEMSGRYEMSGSQAAIAPVAVATVSQPSIAVVPAQQTNVPASGQVMTQTGLPATVTPRNPAVSPVAGGTISAVPQAPLSAALGQWSNGFTLVPGIQRSLGLNNLSFSIAGGMVLIALVLTVSGGSYAGYRYARRGD